MPRILAIDPGTSQSAYVLWDGSTVHAKGILPNEELRALLLSRDLAPYDFVACEMIAAMGQRVGSEVFDTVLFTGRIQEVVSRQLERFVLVKRSAVKRHLLGKCVGKDKHIRQALIDKHGAPGTKKAPGALFGVSSHIWAAMAVADYAITNEA